MGHRLTNHQGHLQGLTLPFLLLPDGRLRSRRWRPAAAAAVAGVAGRVAVVVTISGLVLYAVSLLAALVCVVLRFRASRGVEHQQLRWVAVAVLVLPLPGGEWLPAFMTVVGLLCVPVWVAVAVSRYRLWDLDRLISCTVTYLLVTGLLVLPYLLILPAATRLAAGPRTWSTGASIGAATTPPAPWRCSRLGSESRSTWMPSRPGCWRWSTRPWRRPGRRCGCVPRPARPGGGAEVGPPGPGRCC